MDWRAFIHTDPAILRGKPVMRGTRLSVEFLLDLLAEGWTQQQLLENYPQFAPDAVRALSAFIPSHQRTTGDA